MSLGGLRLTVDFNMRYCQSGQVERQAMTRNGHNLRISLSHTTRGYTKLEEYFAKWGIAKLKFYPYRRISRVITTRGSPQNQNKIEEESEFSDIGNSVTGLKKCSLMSYLMR